MKTEPIEFPLTDEQLAAMKEELAAAAPFPENPEDDPAYHDEGKVRKGSLWIEAAVTKEYPIEKGGKYLVEPVKEVGQKGIYFLLFRDGSGQFDQSQNLSRVDEAVMYYKFTGHCRLKVK